MCKTLLCKETARRGSCPTDKCISGIDISNRDICMEGASVSQQNMHSSTSTATQPNGTLPELLSQIRDSDWETFVTIPRLFILFILDLTNKVLKVQQASDHGPDQNKRLGDSLYVLKQFVSSEFNTELNNGCHNVSLNNEMHDETMHDGIQHNVDRSWSALSTLYNTVVYNIHTTYPNMSSEDIHFSVVNLMNSSDSNNRNIIRTSDQKSLWLAIEKWSMEIQRHSASQWNTMMKVVLRSVTEIEELSSGEKIRAQFSGGGYYSSSRKDEDTMGISIVRGNSNSNGGVGVGTVGVVSSRGSNSNPSRCVRQPIGVHIESTFQP